MDAERADDCNTAQTACYPAPVPGRTLLFNACCKVVLVLCLSRSCGLIRLLSVQCEKVTAFFALHRWAAAPATSTPLSS
jgi:hypothetical protein